MAFQVLRLIQYVPIYLTHLSLQGFMSVYMFARPVPLDACLPKDHASYHFHSYSSIDRRVFSQKSSTALMVENWIFEFFYVTCRHSTSYHAYFIYVYWVAVVLQLCRFMGDTFVVYEVMFPIFITIQTFITSSFFVFSKSKSRCLLFDLITVMWTAEIDVRRLWYSLLSIFLVLLSIYSGHRTVPMCL